MKKLLSKLKIWYWKRFNYEQYLMYEFRKRFSDSKQKLVWATNLDMFKNFYVETYYTNILKEPHKPNSEKANQN